MLINLLIAEIRSTSVGLLLVDADGSTEIDLAAQDALQLADWVNEHRSELEVMVGQMKSGALHRLDRPGER
ncbi:MAG: hypothetical protein ACRDIV_17510 [Ktedonobacteraceae bacterium]